MLAARTVVVSVLIRCRVGMDSEAACDTWVRSDKGLPSGRFDQSRLQLCERQRRVCRRRFRSLR